MKIIIESTTKIVEVNGIPARIWEGKTESGIKVHAFITLIAAPLAADQHEFQRELRKQKVPRLEVAAIPLRLIL